MQRHQQLCCGFRVRSSVRSRFATWQLWPLAVTVLRSGLIFTKGHPFQGPGGAYANSLVFLSLGVSGALWVFWPERPLAMHKGTRPKALIGTASAHVTREEEQRVRQRAAEAGLTKSEWCRRVLLQALEAPQETRLLLSELLALRMIVLRLYLDLIEGDQPTKERVKEILERADATKHALADQRIESFHSQTAFWTASRPAEASRQ
jgi:hypothetical protein